MKIYLVLGHIFKLDETESTWIYGIFSSKEKAYTIANELRQNILENKENEEIEISEMFVDKPTSWYHFMMCN